MKIKEIEVQVCSSRTTCEICGVTGDKLTTLKEDWVWLNITCSSPLKGSFVKLNRTTSAEEEYKISEVFAHGNGKCHSVYSLIKLSFVQELFPL